MKKVSIARAGAYEQLRIVEAAALVPGAGEVRVDVAFAGVNYADCVVRMGLYESAKKYVGWPITPGFEVAGTVGAVGPGARVCVCALCHSVTLSVPVTDTVSQCH